MTGRQPRRALKSVPASSSCASALGSGALRLAAGGFLVAASAGSSWSSPYAATCPQRAQGPVVGCAAPGSMKLTLVRPSNVRVQMHRCEATLPRHLDY